METIDEILKKSNSLPSLPAIVFELQKCLDQNNTGTKLLAEKISSDQALSAKTLRLANSPLYNMQCVVGTVKQAVAVLGFDSVRTMVTTAAITNSFVAKQMPADFDFEDFWRHAIATGLCAKALAKIYDVDPDQAFMAGLLHDIGKLVLAIAYPDKFMEANRNAKAQQRPAYLEEQALLGCNHAEVGARLAKQWNFPQSIQKAIEEHESPTISKEEDGLVALVHVADCVVLSFGLAVLDQEEIPDQPFPNPVWRSTNESDGILCQVARDTKVRVNEVCKSLLAQ